MTPSASGVSVPSKTASKMMRAWLARPDESFAPVIPFFAMVPPIPRSIRRSMVLICVISSLTEAGNRSLGFRGISSTLPSVSFPYVSLLLVSGPISPYTPAMSLSFPTVSAISARCLLACGDIASRRFRSRSPGLALSFSLATLYARNRSPSSFRAFRSSPSSTARLLTLSTLVSDPSRKRLSSMPMRTLADSA